MAVKKKGGKHRVKKTKSKTKAKATATVKSPPKTSKKTSKKEIKSKKSRLPVYTSLGVLAAVILAFAGFYGYLIYQQSRADAYNSSVYEIQIRTEQKMTKLNPLFQEFVAAPSYAKALVSKFKEAASITKRAVLALRTLDPPKRSEAQHKKLIKMYTKGSKLYSDLFELAIYIKKRDSAIQSLVKELKAFSGQMSDANTRFEALEIAKKAQKKIEDVLREVKQLKSPINVYNNKILIKYTEALNNHLKEFQEAAANNSTYGIQTALYNIQVDFSQNWQKAFVSADKKAIVKYDQRVKLVESLQ